MAEYTNAPKRKPLDAVDPIEDKKIEKVVSGKVVVKKKNEVKKFANLFIPDDVSNVKSYIVFDVVVPTIKKTILEIMELVLLNGDVSRTTKQRLPGSRVSYSSYSDRDRPGVRSPSPIRYNKPGYDMDDVILDSRGEAEEVLSRMCELINRYGIVSIGDYYDLLGVVGSYTDHKYGWTDLRSASIGRSGGGYVIQLPRSMPID